MRTNDILIIGEWFFKYILIDNISFIVKTFLLYRIEPCILSVIAESTSLPTNRIIPDAFTNIVMKPGISLIIYPPSV